MTEGGSKRCRTIMPTHGRPICTRRTALRRRRHEAGCSRQALGSPASPRPSCSPRKPWPPGRVMPGFVDTHHHQYETILRGILADGVLGSLGDGRKTYQGVIQGVFTPIYQPEDAYISELVASLNQ